MNLIGGIINAVMLARGIINEEVRMIRRQIVLLLGAIACLAASFVLVLAAAGYFLWGIHQYFAAHLPPAVAAGTVSAVAFLLALFFAGIAAWRLK